MRHRSGVRPQTLQGWFGLALIVSMAGLAAVASQLPPPQFEPVGARLLALAAPLALMGIGVVLVLQDRAATGRTRDRTEEHWSASDLRRPALIYGVLFVYTYLVTTGLDRWVYWIVSGLFAALAGWLIATPPRLKATMMALVVGLALSGTIMWSFSSMLYVDIAR